MNTGARLNWEFPKSIGGFAVLKRLGGGGMGDVYLANDPAIERKIAIKVVRRDAVSDPKYRNEQARKLFAEARAAGNLSHPGIVIVHAAGEDQGLLFIIMEYIDGPSLEGFVNSGFPLTAGSARKILSEAAAALDYAHGKHIIHRDVKPANIMLSRNFVVKICDFGIAKQLGVSAQSSVLMGSPSYMSPEQLRWETLDSSTDQWSLAVVAYQLLTGTLPFQGQSLDELAAQIIGVPPQPIHERNSTLAPQASSVMERALAKRPEARFESCRAFVETLLRACDSNPDWTPVAPASPTQLGDASPPHDINPLFCPVCGSSKDPQTHHCVFCENILSRSPAVRDSPTPGPVESEWITSGQQSNERVQSGLMKAKGLLLVQDYDEAIALLAELSSHPGANLAIHGQLVEARRLQGLQQLRDRRERGLRESKDLIRRGELAEACAVLENLNRQSPNDASIQELLVYARGQAEAERRRAEVDRLIAQARASFDAGDLLPALETVRLARALDPSNVRLAALERSIIEAQRAKEEQQTAAAEVEARKRKIDEGVREAQRFLASQDPASATRILQGLTQQFPAESVFQDLLARAHKLQKEQDERSAVEGILKRAQNLSERCRWDEAIALVERELRERPDCGEFLRELRGLREQGAIADDAAEIERELKRQDFDRAFELADAACLRHPAHARVKALFIRAEEGRQLANLLRSANSSLSVGDLEQARQLVASGRIQFPQSDELRHLAGKIESAHQRQQSITGAKSAVQIGQFDRARKIAEEIAAEDPLDPASRLLFEEIEKKHAEHERREALSAGRAEAERLLRLNQFDEAEAQIASLAQMFPDELALQEDLDRVGVVRQREERKHAYHRAHHEAEHMVAQGRFDEAIASMEALLQDFPRDLAIVQNIEAARAAKQLHERRLKMDERIAALEELFRKGDAEAVQKGAGKLYSECDEPRCRELLNWANASLAQAQKIRGERRRLTRQNWPWTVITAGVVVAIALTLLRASVRIPKPPVDQPQASGKQTSQEREKAPSERAGGPVAPGSAPADVRKPVNPPPLEPSRLEISQQELEFAYQEGDAPPKSQSISVNASGGAKKWSVSGVEDWFSISPSAGDGSGTVEVRVDPSRVTVGDYKAVASFSGHGGSSSARSLRVHLRVISLPVVPPPPPIETAVDCLAPEYRGLPSGVLTWRGELPPGGTVVLARHYKVFQGGGTQTGNPLPGCAVTIDTQPSTVVSEGPSLGDNYATVTLRNSSNVTVRSVKLTWKRKID